MRVTILSSHQELLRHVLSALGVGSAMVASSGCGGQTVSGDPPLADAWPFATGDERLRARVAQVFDRMHEHVGFGAQTSLPADADQMRAHGYVGADERRRIATAVIENVIRPAARALFAVAESARAATCRRVA